MDIDIDIEPNLDIKKLFPNAVQASMVEEGELKKHNVGYLFQKVPQDQYTKLCAIPYKQLEDFDYYKIDLLTVNALESFNSKEEMIELSKKEPDWNLLEDEENVKKLFHLGKHYEIVNTVKPVTIIQLADIFCLIRPNKRKLLYKYIRDPGTIRKELYTKRAPEDMRKSHALGYAVLIVLQLHLIEMGRL